MVTAMYSGQTVPTEIIVVHGPASCSGKTTIALYLAYLYANKGCPAVLVDLTQYGSITPWLRLPKGASSGLAGLLSSVQGAPGTSPNRGMIQAPGGGQLLQLVLSSGPAKMDKVTADDVESLLKQMAAAGHVVIVDTGSELTSRVVGALLASTRIALTLTPTVTAGWHGAQLLDILRSAYIPRERLGVIFNRIKPGGRFGLDEFIDTIGLPVLGLIPEAEDLRLAAEVGGPPNVRGDQAGLLAIRKVAHQLIPLFAPKELRSSWLWRK